MPIDFPNSPLIGQRWTNPNNNIEYIWNDTRWDSLGSGSGVATKVGFRNKVMNGRFVVDQWRNYQPFTLINNSPEWIVDRWFARCLGGNATTQVVNILADPDPYRLRITGGGGITSILTATRMESADTADLAGKTVTLSFNSRNTLLTSMTWRLFRANTQDLHGPLTAPTKTLIASGTFTVNNIYSRYNTQITIPPEATTGLELQFEVGAQTSGFFEIGKVQLEEGLVETEFEIVPASLELLNCQRFFVAFSGVDLYMRENSVAATTYGLLIKDFPAFMRTIPTQVNIGTVTALSAGCSFFASYTNQTRVLWLFSLTNTPNVDCYWTLASGRIGFVAEIP